MDKRNSRFFKYECAFVLRIEQKQHEKDCNYDHDGNDGQ